MLLGILKALLAAKFLFFINSNKNVLTVVYYGVCVFLCHSHATIKLRSNLCNILTPLL